MNKPSKIWINAVAVAALAACFATAPARAAQQAAAQPTENQDAKDIKAFVLDQTKFDQITASFGEIAACRKQNRAPWDTLTGRPRLHRRFADRKSKNDGRTSRPVHSASQEAQLQYA